ncbi:MAG: HAMP domain-containing histidine kinase, partial [Gemmatimonadota bacterium]|nr:HAMP domain-containing histidine kinase [Gemmatimonadota bacterium]
ARVTVDAGQVFPTEELLDHVPVLVDGIADYLEADGLDIDGHGPMEAKAMELGALRHAQGFDAYQILKEHEILSGILFTFLREALDAAKSPASASVDIAACWQRVADATDKIRQATITHFLRMAGEEVRSREERLRRFNRMVSHELKNRVGALRGAATMLSESWVNPAQAAQFLRIIEQNGEGLQRVLENLDALSHLDRDTRQKHNVLLPQAAAEAVRQLRDAASLGQVEVRMDEAALPDVEVDAAAVELCLANYLSNAIKYADPAKGVRWAEISAELVPASPEQEGELIIRVKDNGLGVPADARPKLFEQFFRAHTATVSAEGTGLGLNIVQETMESLGGRAWAEFPDEGGSVFAISFPSRRAEDADVALEGIGAPALGAEA